MIDRNDPRLTAYALGEMDAPERAEFEKMLATDAVARAEVEAIRALGGNLSAELARSTAPALTEGQRASVAKAARRRVPVAILLMPLAACLFAAVTFFVTRGPSGGGASFEAQQRHEMKRAAQDADGKLRESARTPAEPEPAPTSSDAPFFSSPNGATPGSREPGDSPVAGPDRKPPQITLQGIDEQSRPPPPSDPASPGDMPVRGFADEATGAGGPAPAAPAGQPEAKKARDRKEVEKDTFEAGAKRSGPAFASSAIAVESPAKAGADEGARRRLGVPEERITAEKVPLDREAYDRIRDNPFIRVADEHSSTFSIDVDTASYANVRRFLMQQHRLPPPDAVRVEEMINYFAYGYEPPAAGSPHPFRIHVEVAQCPWDGAHRLARVAIKGKTIDHRERPASNLVFLVDVSGSMNEPNKLPLVQASLRMLAENLGDRDRVAIAVYAGAAGLVLPSTGDKKEVVEAIERLRAGGSTAGAAGIELAYRVAAENFVKEGTNRVILCTDGDFNVGISDDGSLSRLIEEKAKTGVFLSVLGFGTGNYQDAKMQQLADKGNGNHAYIDSILEARKVLGEEMSATLVTIAKDVKIQLFFNPRTVAGFRLIGYENRLLAKQDFNDDTKDAGEIGAGHCVTALYEIVPAGSAVPAAPAVDENPFVAKEKAAAEAAGDSDALFQLRLRYKQPDGDKSELIEQMVKDGAGTFDGATPDFRWAGAVAAFGMNLRGTAGMGLDAVFEIAKGASGDDKYRREFLQLVETAKLLSR